VKTELVCPVCGSSSLTTRNESEEFTFRSGGVDYPVRAEYPVHECSACGESFLSQAAESARHAATCSAMNRLCPTEIVELRARLGLTRKGFAQLSGIGEASLARWETGELIQSESNDNLLRLLTLDENVSRLSDLRNTKLARLQPSSDREPRRAYEARPERSMVHARFTGLSREAIDRAGDNSRRFRLKGMSCH
jgi:putative zinc finger/helix-turn-helix YgiT family protein